MLCYVVRRKLKLIAKKLSGSESKKTVNLLYTYKKLILKHLDNRFYYALLCCT